jgi:N-dimethylarginine dimethylaminohydrolase
MTQLQRPRVLMCPPEYFAVEYVINPWMEGQVGRTDHDRARRQWDQLYSAISSRTLVEGDRQPFCLFGISCFTAAS